MQTDGFQHTATRVTLSQRTEGDGGNRSISNKNHDDFFFSRPQVLVIATLLLSSNTGTKKFYKLINTFITNIHM